MRAFSISGVTDPARSPETALHGLKRPYTGFDTHTGKAFASEVRKVFVSNLPCKGNPAHTFDTGPKSLSSEE